jgi:hypothetical protein
VLGGDVGSVRVALTVKQIERLWWRLFKVSKREDLKAFGSESHHVAILRVNALGSLNSGDSDDLRDK